MDWDAYAEHYDEMCALNPAYEQNLRTLLNSLQQWNLPENANICDLGAGTGNFILQLSGAVPTGRFWHIDVDNRMIEMARKKYEKANLERVTVLRSNAHSVDFQPEFFDVILCVNALYAFGDQQEVLNKMRSWLKPSGRLFLIDFGRKQRTYDWAFYMFKESIKSGQVRRYTRALIEGLELLKQNRRTTRGQSSGRYWLHTTEEFGETLRKTGFRVEELKSCYRGYADLAICGKSD